MSTQLRHIRELLARGEPLPPASSGWLVRAVDRLLAGDDSKNALELDHAGALRERNRLLCEGASSLHGATWTRAETIAKLAGRHQSGRKSPDWLIQANQAAKIPGTARQIYDIIR